MNILKSFGVYTVAGILGRVASFLLLPFFTHYLSRSDYGLLNIFSNSVYFITPFMTLGIGETFSVEYVQSSKEEMKQFIGTSFFLPFAVFAVTILSLLLFGHFFESKTGLSQYLLFLVVLLSVFNFFTDYLLIIFRNQNKPLSYAVFNLARTVLELVLAVVFIKYLQKGVNGRVNSVFFTSLSAFLFVLIYFIRNGLVNISFSRKWFATILKRGIPAIPLFFMIFVLGNADKYMLNYYYGAETVGLYGLAWQFAMVLSMVTGAFMTPFYPFLYQHLEKKEYSKIAKAVLLYAGGLLLCILLALALLPLVFRWLIAPAFHQSLEFIPYLLFGQLFWAMFLVLCGYIYYKRRNSVFYYLCPSVITATLCIDYLLLVKYHVANFAVVSFLSYLLCFLALVLVLRNDWQKAFSILRFSFSPVVSQKHENVNR